MRVVFLDRDGVINRYPGDTKYVTSLSGFRFLPNAKKAITILTKAGFKVFIISNQAGVSKGIYSKASLGEITRYMLKKVNSAGGKIDGVYHCTHQDRHNCLCRKPRAGLIYKALKEKKIDKSALKDSYFVGDTIRDVITAKRAGLKSILVFSGKEKPQNKGSWDVLPDYTAKNLSEAVELILK